MRIIKTSEDKLQKDAIRKKANIGCHICPCCGESRDLWDCIQAGISQEGITSGTTSWAEGFFNVRIMHSDHYYCLTCGAEWESEPY